MKKRILIVDDDAQERQAIRDRLKKEGYKDIVTAKTGFEALEKTVLEKPDTVILETWLPDMTGFDVCRLIKESKDVNTRVVMTTNVVYDADEARAKEAGADHYIVKRKYF